MRLASAAQPARTRLASADRLSGVPRNTRGEHGQFLLQLRRAAMRAFSSLPFGGPHQDFAVPVAFVTMKFVDRHGPKVAGRAKISSHTSWLEPEWALDTTTIVAGDATQRGARKPRELAAGTAALRGAGLRPASSGGFQPPVLLLLSRRTQLELES